MMDFLKMDSQFVGADCSADGEQSSAALQARLDALLDEFSRLSVEGVEPARQADILLDVGRLQNQLRQQVDAWETGREAFKHYAAAEEWEGAIQACDIMFQAEQPESLVALAHGLWLAVTYPVDPELSVVMLQHLVDETPEDADGAAVAAVTACYLTDLRAEEGSRKRENLLFFTNQILAQVARRHGGVASQEAFEQWMQRLELDDPAKFLPRLAQVVDVLAQGHWWLDREALRARLPVN